MPLSHRQADLSKHLSPTAIKNDTEFIKVLIKYIKKIEKLTKLEFCGRKNLSCDTVIFLKPYLWDIHKYLQIKVYDV